MLKHLRVDIFELQETKLLIRLTNTTNEWILVQGRGGHETTQLRVNGDIKDVSSELDSGEGGSKGCISWIKRPGYYCSR
ncbi:hypothetical protein TNCV_4804151 [Trichonephila clavipes]|nr:hypothetical protein TNCV_4804151 [Trichonephila clavipes]